jgi:hypothetical protein
MRKVYLPMFLVFGLTLGIGAAPPKEGAKATAKAEKPTVAATVLMRALAYNG